MGKTVGVCPTCPVPNVGASSCIPVSLERIVCPQVGPLDLIDGPSQHFYHCALFPWALVSAPALVSWTNVLIGLTFHWFFLNLLLLVVWLVNSEFAFA